MLYYNYYTILCYAAISCLDQGRRVGHHAPAELLEVL